MMVRRCDRCKERIDGFYTRVVRLMREEGKTAPKPGTERENDLCLECERAFIKFMEEGRAEA